jgi:hypothetical protein
MAQDNFIFMNPGSLMLFLDRIIGSIRSRHEQRQQGTVSVMRYNVRWRSQVRFLTACVIARRAGALVGIQRRCINSLGVSCKCLGPERCSVVD